MGHETTHGIAGTRDQISHAVSKAVVFSIDLYFRFRAWGNKNGVVRNGHAVFVFITRRPPEKTVSSSWKQPITMETPTKPLRGMAIIRRMVEIKEEGQRDAVETYRTNPEIRAIVEKLKEVNGKRARG